MFSDVCISMCQRLCHAVDGLGATDVGEIRGMETVNSQPLLFSHMACGESLLGISVGAGGQRTQFQGSKFSARKAHPQLSIHLTREAP